MTDDQATPIAAEVVNFRDFGGLQTEDGQHVRQDRLYRSGHLADAGPQTTERLLALDFGLIADLRYSRERRNSRSPWPIDYADRILCHDEEQDLDAPHLRLLNSPTLSEDEIRPFYVEFYRKLPFDKPYMPIFGETLRRLGQQDGRALIHCSIGKDRTGVLAAIVQRALGCPVDAVLEDYMVSRTAPGLVALIPEIHRILHTQLGRSVSIGIAEELLLVREEYMAASLAAIDEACGSFAAYLETIGVDAAAGEALRRRLLV